MKKLTDCTIMSTEEFNNLWQWNMQDWKSSYVLGRLPPSSMKKVDSKKFSDLHRNHKFSGRLLGINLTVITVKHGRSHCWRMH